MAIKGVFKIANRLSQINDATLLNTDGTKRINDMALAVTGLSKEQALLALSTAKVNAEDTKSVMIKAGVITAEEAETMAIFADTTATTADTVAKSANLGITELLTVAWAKFTAVVKANPFIFLTAGAIALVAAMGKIADRVQNAEKYAKKALDKTAEKVDNVKSEIESLNSELETTRNRIDELNAKENLTLVEREELERLKETNAELERELRIKQSILSEEQKEANKDAKKYFTTKKDSLEFESSYEGVEIHEKTDYIGTVEERIEKLQQYADGQIKLSEETIKAYKDYVESALSDFMEEDDYLVEGLDDGLLDRLDALYKKYDIYTNGKASVTENKLRDILAKADFQNMSKQLEELGKSGELSIDTLSSSFPKLINYLDEAGISAEELYQYIMALSNPDAINYSEVKKQLLYSIGGRQDEASEFLNKILSLDDEELVLEAYLKVRDQYGEHPEGWTGKDWLTNIQNELNSEEPLEIQILFGQLNKSEESLDKFQSSVKSAADAYSTLLSGNYSSSELLDSIQAINKAATDMGESIAWEEIDSLDLLGDKLEEVSQKYAESITGIDVDGGFGKILANIIQAQKASTQLEVLNDQIDSLQTAYSNLTDIVETYNETGYITFDQLQTLLEMEPQYLSCLIDENGQLQLNEAAMTELANKRLDDAEAQAIQQAITELGQIALQDEKQAVQENAEAFTNAIDDLANYNAELANTIAEATVGASAIRDLNAAINGAESQGATDDQINTVLNNLETKLQLIGNVRDKVASGGLGSVVKPESASKAGKEAGDAYVSQFEKSIEELQNLREQGKHICPLLQ